jgi:signal peptidase I
MPDTSGNGDERTLLGRFRTSEHWVVSLARDILWLVAVVGGIALTLYLICGTWPAVVTIESESMVPHMNVGDLVVVVQKDRFGELQPWDQGKTTGYQKFGDYGDVIIYRPNGIQDFWSSVGLLTLSKQHPIIHRAITWTGQGEPEPLYLNIYRGKVTPDRYVPLVAGDATINGYTILYTGSGSPPANITPDSRDILMRTPSGNYILPFAYILPDAGYIRASDTITSHGGYITKGDNNIASDQGYLSVPGSETVEPVKKEWVVGKALFAIPLVGLLPLYIKEVVIVMVIAMLLYEWYLRRKEASGGNDRKKGKNQKGKNPAKKIDT